MDKAGGKGDALLLKNVDDSDPSDCLKIRLLSCFFIVSFLRQVWMTVSCFNAVGPV